MSFFENMALFLFGFILICLLTVMGKRVNAAVRKAGYKGRSSRDAAVDGLVRLEVMPDEQLLWVDRWREQPIIGALVAVLSIAGLCIFMMLFLRAGEIEMKLFCTPFICFTASGINYAIFVLFRRSRNYFFITTKRMAFRGKSMLGKTIYRDVKASHIKGVTLIDSQIYGIHVSYRIFVSIDVGKRKPRLTVIVPERDSVKCADAINAIIK